jgi:hypothetical protein
MVMVGVSNMGAQKIVGTCTNMKNTTMVDNRAYTWEITTLRGVKTFWKFVFYFYIYFLFIYLNYALIPPLLSI